MSFYLLLVLKFLKRGRLKMKRGEMKMKFPLKCQVCESLIVEDQVFFAIKLSVNEFVFRQCCSHDFSISMELSSDWLREYDYVISSITCLSVFFDSVIKRLLHFKLEKELKNL